MPSLSPMSPALPVSYLNDEFRNIDATSTKSLTPQRKHRKLLKDGSGIEVWPESVERIFVEGLRKYWESPYATSSQSRGRSRWRNQFLVDYLKSAGVERSKKQVASHIQVLRNMWKGEPEFHLVAGGEELYSEPTRTNVKQEEQGEPFSIGYAEYDDADSSSNGTSPNFSPSDVKSEFPPSPGMSLRVFTHDAHSTFYSSDGIPIPSMIPMTSPSAREPFSVDADTSQFAAYDYSVPSSILPHDRFAPGISAPPTVSHRYVGKPARVKAFNLTAEGINPLCARLDALTSLGQWAPHTPLTLKLKLGISNVMTGHGFTANIYLTSWTHSEKCSTKLFINGHMESSEDASLILNGSGDGYVTATLPESRLNQCRWLDPSLSVVVTQEIIADDQTLLFIIYVMDHTIGGDLPSTELLNYWKYNHNDKANAAHMSVASTQTSQQAVAHHSYHNTFMSSSPNHGDQVSYMYAPLPSRHGLYALSTSTTC